MAEGETKTREERPYWLPFIIALVMFIALNLFYFRPDLVEETGFSFQTWVTIGYLVTVVMLAWLFIWKITLNTEVEPDAKAGTETAVEPVEEVEPEEGAAEEAPKKRPKKARPKRVVVAVGAAGAGEAKEEEPPEGLHRPEDVLEEEMEDIPRVIEYPLKEPGGVYSDTLLRVDTNLILNLRVLLGSVCHNCEELEDCMRRVEGKLDEDVFLYNFECKDGLKRELHKARKEREKEEAKAKAAKERVEKKASEAKDEPTKKEPPPKKKKPAKKGKEKASEAKDKPTKKEPPSKKTTAKKGKERASEAKDKQTKKEPPSKKTTAKKGKEKASSPAGSGSKKSSGKGGKKKEE